MHVNIPSNGEAQTLTPLPTAPVGPRPAADLHGSAPALSGKGSGSQGQRSIRPLLGGSQASMRPSVEQVMLSELQSSHPLIRLQQGGEEAAKSGKLWLSSDCDFL